MNQIQFYIDPLQNAFDAVELSYMEPFTRETIGDLIKAHHVKGKTINLILGKILIIARVEAIDPFYKDNPSDERSEIVVFYYNAHYLNKLIFRKQGPLNNCYTFRMNCLNPLTETQIINISYFAVDSESIGFDDLAELEDSPLLSNIPLFSDLFNQSLEKVENTFIVDKYSVPINSDSFTELPTPIEPKPKSFMYSSDSVNEDSSDLNPSLKRMKSVVVKSEACLSTSRKRMSLNLSGKTMHSLAPRAFSSNQLSLFKKMLRKSAEGLSRLPSHSQKYQNISPNNTSVFFGGTSLTVELDTFSEIDGKSWMQVNQPSYSLSSFSPKRDFVEQEKLPKAASQLKPRLDSVTEERNRIITKSYKDTDIEGQCSSSSRDLLESSFCESQSSRDPLESSFSFSDTSSCMQTLKFKGLFIGTDDEFLQCPMIRLLFQANALACEAADILPADIDIDV
jgi:hypothetical protein